MVLSPDFIEEVPRDTLRIFQDLESSMRGDAASSLTNPEAADRAGTRAAIAADSNRLKKPIATSVKDTMIEAAKVSALSDEAVYDAARTAGLLGPSAPLADSKAMEQVLRDGIATVADMTNIVRTSAEQRVSFEFIDALDRAVLEITTGAKSRDAAIRTAIDIIARTESSVTYTSVNGQRVRSKLYGAVRRAVTTGTNQTTLRMQDVRFDEVGATDWEITAHFGARPEHATWQGQVIADKDLVSRTGYGTGPGLGGWNCHHSKFPFFPDIMEELDPDTIPSQAENAEQYDLSQRQRLAERNVRTYQTRSDIYRDAERAGHADIEEYARAEKERNAALARKWRKEAERVAKLRDGAVRTARQAAGPGEAGVFRL